MTQGMMEGMTTKIKAKERSLTLMSITIVSVFVVCNSFYSIYYILRSQGLLNNFGDQYIHSTARVFAIINSSANIVIYIVFNSKFRETFVSLFTRFSFDVTEDPTTSGKVQATSRDVVSK
jgi:hypothetical protein